VSQLVNIQELETLLQQHAALFYQLHQRETTERFKRQELRETLTRVLGLIREAQEVTQGPRSNNLLAALCVRSAGLKHQITGASHQIQAIGEQAELAEQCYEEILDELEALMSLEGSDLANQAP